MQKSEQPRFSLFREELSLSTCKNRSQPIIFFAPKARARACREPQAPAHGCWSPGHRLPEAQCVYTPKSWSKPFSVWKRKCNIQEAIAQSPATLRRRCWERSQPGRDVQRQRAGSSRCSRRKTWQLKDRFQRQRAQKNVSHSRMVQSPLSTDVINP